VFVRGRAGVDAGALEAVDRAVRDVLSEQA
jgi:hypothetical protein